MLCLSWLLAGTGLAQYRSEAPIILIEEDFSDGAFDESWRFSGTGKVLFAAPNNRDFPMALVRIPSAGGSAWSGAQWRRYRDLPWEHERNQVCFDKANDVPVLRFRAFSDFSHSKHFAGVEVAMLEQRAVFDPPPHYGHDLSFEAEQTFWNTTGVVQLDANVENTGNWGVYGLQRAHYPDALPTLEDLDREYDNEIIWRNMPGTGKCNIETWASLNKADFTVSKEMNSELDPDHPLAMFSLVQITLFRDDDNFHLLRTGVKAQDAQIGILSLQLGITRRSDFNLDFCLDQRDLDILLDNWGVTSGASIKEGDASNDGAVGFEDVSPLLAFWQDAFQNPVWARIEYDQASGQLVFRGQGLSYFSLQGPAEAFSGAPAQWEELAAIKRRQDAEHLEAFSMNPWQRDSLNLGPVLAAGLDPDWLTLRVNYPGSQRPEGFQLHFGEELLVEQLQVCPGKQNIYAPELEDVVYSWEPSGDMLLRDKGYWAEISLADSYSTGCVLARATDGEERTVCSKYFMLEVPPVPLVPDTVYGPESLEAGGDTVLFYVEGDTTGLYYEWELSEGLIQVDGQYTDSILICASDGTAAFQAEIRLRVENSCGEGGWTAPREFRVEAASGKTESWEKHLVIYPNPAEKHLAVQGWPDSESVTFRILDLQGRTMLSGEIHSRTEDTAYISLNPLAPGTYLLELRTGLHRMRKVFIKH